jgi:hydroxypyruvate reductase
VPEWNALIAEAHAALAAIQAAADARRSTLAAIRGNPAPTEHIRLLAIGKASLEMTHAAIEAAGDRLEAGLVAAVPERLAALSAEQHASLAQHRIVAMPCDHPLATRRNLDFADAARAFVSDAPANSRLLALLSGGGSAHLASPPAGITIEDLRRVTDAMLRAGAPIGELNAVRKHVETLKGGRLAELCRAPIDCFVISDVIGDRLDVIASGPFAPDPSTFADALDALQRRRATSAAPAITAHLTRGTLGALPETPKPGAALFDRVNTSIIASNAVVVRAASALCALNRGAVFREEQGVERPVEEVAARLVQDIAPHQAAILGGEWSVHVGSSPGTGGPSQELALRVALLLEERGDALPYACLCYSTDGIDGPTDAAGAIVTSETLRTARAHSIDPLAALHEHNSYGFFAAIADAARGSCEHLRTGPTGTNVNHVAVLLT